MAAFNVKMIYSPKIRVLNKAVIFALISVFIFSSCGGNDDLNGEVRTSNTAQLYATSHDGTVKKYDINSGRVSTFTTFSSDAEGIHVADDNDSFVLVSRSGARLEEYTGLNTFQSGVNVDLESQFVGQENLESPRDLAVSGDYYVVSDNTDLDDDETTPEGRLFIYFRSETGFVLRNVVTTRFKVWGLEFINDDLFLAVDESNKVAVYRNFISNFPLNRIITADKIVGFQGIIRAHGLDFEDGIMVISDVGEAGVASDGAIHVISDFESKFNTASAGGFIQADDQQRLSGSNTSLGDPVNVVYDSAYNVIFVADALSGGGRILAFNDARSLDGNISPDLTYNFAGVSALYFYTD